MTREEIKELLPIMQAFAEGKSIQMRTENRPWFDVLGDKLEICKIFEYRIKPEPKYRPFKTKEECWDEMHKHPDFGWIIYDETYHSICEVTPDEITIFYECDPCGIDFKTCIEKVTFADGTPFGIKEK